MTAVPPLVVAMVLGAALLHAAWNAMLRSGADRLWSVTVMCAVGAAACAAATPFLPLPAPAAWPYAGLSALLQVGYCLFLVSAYEKGELGQVYPVARGTAPLLVAIGAAVFAGERLAPQAIAGLALISGGIVALSLGKDRLGLAAMRDALITGVFIAGYMVTDGVGVRLSGHALSYFAWMTLAQGLPMPLVYLAIRKRFPPLRPDADTLKAVGGGIMGLTAYGVVVWALSRAPMAKVSGLRETAILFAAIIGAVFLKERFTLRRGVCALTISVGAILLAG
ncbi:DMT family transporter [Phenylobacterium sp.]|uniref:DMT family transporter n=1 Tax=Phenylobacterium sp. TaxID=1871053 RepID=UPI0025D674EB|nr:DMT family transporter [Phenylobacterium sp.]